jgi:hypothetical protein
VTGQGFRLVNFEFLNMRSISVSNKAHELFQSAVCAFLAVLAADAGAQAWEQVAAERGGHRQGATLVWAGDTQRWLLIGDNVQAFDGVPKTWSTLSDAKMPGNRGIHPYYQTVYDPKTKKVYCLSNGATLYVFDTAAGTWEEREPEPLLEKLSWHMMATDGAGRIVVAGSDKDYANVGWLRAAVLDTATGQWAPLAPPSGAVAEEHHAWVEASESIIDLVGRIRLAWYRDPAGAGTETERAALVKRVDDLAALAVLKSSAAKLANVKKLIEDRALLDALKAARAVQGEVDEAMFAQYPVPRSRRNAPLVYDTANKVFVLFGGDHEDYQMNDTWTLDLTTGQWQLKQPGIAPSPRAGHVLAYLPRSGKVVMYVGYRATENGDYGTLPYYVKRPREMWLYDVKTDKWDFVGAWADAKEGEPATPPSIGRFYGYSASWYEVPPLAADASDTLLLAAPGSKKTAPSTWLLSAGSLKPDTDRQAEFGKPANSRRDRAAWFRAEFSEVADDPQAVDLDNLPANQWVPLKPHPREVFRGARQRDWSTAAWDSHNRQIVYWGGGHCVRSSSVPAHYSPDSNRIVEGYDADEPYCYNGFTGPGSSLLNRQWVDTHAYHLYAYDPKARLMVTYRSFLYDTERMDWVREEPHKQPFAASWGSTVLASSPHGVVAWGMERGKPGLWLYDRASGWQPLTVEGALFKPWCDSHGMAYDSKRDRMVISSVGGAYGKRGDGNFMFYDFKTHALTALLPNNAQLNETGNAREVVYVEHADAILTGDVYRTGKPNHPDTKYFTRIYDCEKNTMHVLDAGRVEYSTNSGWAYDAKRKLVYVMSVKGEAWALRLDMQSAALQDTLPETQK